MPLPKILIIDDDRSLIGTLKDMLNPYYEVHVALHAVSGIRKAKHDLYAAILLDLHLGDAPGSTVCARIRETDTITPIIVISADNAHLKKIQLFEMGADDYIAKPFHIDELKARLRVHIKRAQGHGRGQGTLKFEDLTLDSLTRIVSRAGRQIELRPKEFNLLECLMSRAGTVVTRDMLTNYAWDGNHATWNNAIDVHIKYLRDKIDRPFDKPLIQTVHGVGYSLRNPGKSKRS